MLYNFDSGFLVINIDSLRDESLSKTDQYLICLEHQGNALKANGEVTNDRDGR